MALPDLRFLPAFLAVHESRNLTRAAARLRRTQPALSYQLRALESALGAPLFLRDRTGMVPTELGDGLQALVGRFAAELDDLLRGGDDRSRPLAVASVSGFGRYVLAPLLRRPPFDGQRIALHFPVTQEVVDRTLRGDADVGFVFRPTSHAGLEAEPVYDATYVLVAAPTWARRLRRPADFDGVPLVTYDESDYVVGRWLGHHFGRRPPGWRSADHFEELEEVLAAVAGGRGVAVVPGVCAAGWRGAKRGALREIRWGKPPLLNTVYALRRSRAPLRPSVAALLEAIRIGVGSTSRR
jgi:DNA-binding transcriptional LysR family regulator